LDIVHHQGMSLLCLTAILPAFKRMPECTARAKDCSLVHWQLPLLFELESA
jgi:solute carrier family 15 (peptide/histidine transporter), member 3/4